MNTFDLQRLAVRFTIPPSKSLASERMFELMDMSLERNTSIIYTVMSNISAFASYVVKSISEDLKKTYTVP